MKDDNFVGTEEGLQKMLNSDKKLTIYSSIDKTNYYHQMKDSPCSLKLVWKSPDSSYETFAIAKNSPLKIFFEDFFKKVVESGTLKKIEIKWRQKETKDCGNVEAYPVFFEKIFSLIVMLSISLGFSMLILLLEVLYTK